MLITTTLLRPRALALLAAILGSFIAGLAQAAPTPPGQPQFEIVGTTSKGADVRVTWAEPTSGKPASYRYRGGVNTGGGWSTQGETANRTIVLRDVPLGGSYWLCTRAVGADRVAGPEACNSFTTHAATPPATPGQPQFQVQSVTAQGADIRVSWAPSASDNVIEYIYRAESTQEGNRWSATGRGSERQVLLEGVPLAGAYSFCVKASANGLEGGERCNSFSTPASANPISVPGRPTFNETVTDKGSQVKVSWARPATGMPVAYHYRSGLEGGGWSQQGKVGTRSLVLEALQPGQYWFCLSAEDRTGSRSGETCNSFTTTAPPVGAKPGQPVTNECASPRPEWIWCDDFEQDRIASYYEASMPRKAGVGVNGSTAVVGRYLLGTSEAGNLKLGFGRTPRPSMRPVDGGSRNYREIYWRVYVRTPANWQGGGADKLSRATVIGGSNLQQAMIAHVWSGADPGPNQNYLMIDPATGVDASGRLVTTRYNDFNNLRWLGARRGSTPLFEPARRGQWQCVEARVRLNDAGQANGIFELWVNDKLDVRRTDLNWVGSYNAYGINAVFLENYWNAGTRVEQERYLDNFVVSTARIGC